jgi:hypothetical protein
MKLFHLNRVVDETGVSGTGVVAGGIVWPNGKVAMQWYTSTSSVAFYESIDDVKTIHGHGGKTRVEFL